MSSPIPVRVTEARLAARENATAAGIDQEFISELVDTFYEHIRAHPALGPIFEGEIGENWDTHLATMKSFWSSLAFHDGGYSGRPMPAHVKLKGLTPGHFSVWLGLFEHTLEEIGATDEAKSFFLERAHRIATSFQLHIFGLPEINTPNQKA